MVTRTSLLGLQQAAAPLTDQQLLDQFDERQRQERATQDAYFASEGAQGARESALAAVNRQQAEGATGPGGYNRSWVPFLESMRGKRMRMAPGGAGRGIASDPTSSFNTQEGPYGQFGAGTGGVEPTGTGEVASLADTPATQLAVLSSKKKKPSPPGRR